MPTMVVGIADMKITNDPEAVIVTYSLGSCLGMTVWDPVVRVGGMIHIMLPDSQIDQSDMANPYKFVNTGIPLLFKESYKFGCQKQRMIVKLTGCSQILDDNGFFNIGQRNLAAARKMLWKNGVLVAAEDVGGNGSRTIRLNVGSGALDITLGNKERRTL